MRKRQKRREKQVKACLHCRRSFDARANAEYCSHRCRMAGWRERKAQGQDERDREITASLDEAAQAIHRARVAVSGEGEESS